MFKPSLELKIASYEQKRVSYERKLASYEQKRISYEHKLVSYEQIRASIELKTLSAELKLVSYEQKITSVGLKTLSAGHKPIFYCVVFHKDLSKVLYKLIFSNNLIITFKKPRHNCVTCSNLKRENQPPKIAILWNRKLLLE